MMNGVSEKAVVGSLVQYATALRTCWEDSRGEFDDDLENSGRPRMVTTRHTAYIALHG